MNVQIIRLEDKDKAQIEEQMAMTPQERLYRACELIDFAKAFASEKEVPESESPESIHWITLSIGK